MHYVLVQTEPLHRCCTPFRCFQQHFPCPHQILLICTPRASNRDSQSFRVLTCIGTTSQGVPWVIVFM